MSDGRRRRRRESESDVKVETRRDDRQEYEHESIYVTIVDFVRGKERVVMVSKPDAVMSCKQKGRDRRERERKSREGANLKKCRAVESEE